MPRRKVIYIANVNLEGVFLLGVVEKIKGQLVAFRKSGFETDVLYPIRDGGVVIKKHDGTKSVFKGSRETFLENGLVSKIKRHVKVMWRGSLNFHHCENQIIQGGYDTIYLRFYLPGLDLIRLLKNVRRNSPQTVIFLEYPTTNISKLFKSDLARRVAYLVNRRRIVRLNKLSDYLITLTKDKILFGRPAVFMANGIEMSEISPVQAPAFAERLILLGVASDCAFYHGFDKVIAGIAEYNSKPNEVSVIFRIITNPASNNVNELKEQVKRLGVQNCITFENTKSREELVVEYANVHLGVGTLALHRIHLMENYSLKHREYAAFGLPFIMSKGDEHFEHSHFVLTVERDEAPLPVQKVVEFYKKIREKYPDYPNIFRKSVENQITWEGQMQGVFDVIEKGQISGRV